MDAKKNGMEAAHPGVLGQSGYGNATLSGENGDGTNRLTEFNQGLTKREYFAGLAMEGMCANPECTSLSAQAITRMAVEHADALLEQMAKDPPK